MTKQQVPEMIELVTCEELVAKCPSAAEHFRHKDDISGENFDNLPTLEKMKSVNNLKLYQTQTSIYQTIMNMSMQDFHVSTIYLCPIPPPRTV